jgi:glutamate-1-semialdehyde 2,1-aminomutase
MKFKRSQELFDEAQKILVGGVNSPVRAFKSVGGSPLFIKKAKGAYIYDADNNKYIDYVGSYGPAILGHAHPEVNEAITRALDNGSCYGASSELETELAKLVQMAFPSVEMIRFVNSGTEAVMSAIRLARGFTNRNKIIKFSGCYHGHSDFLLAQAGSGLMTYGLPGSAGVTEATVKDTLIAPYNHIQALKDIFEQFPEEIAAVIIEPVVGNMGVVLPDPEYLKELRTLTEQYNTLLIFDEVMTGFRQNFGGVQAVYNIKPDITCLGKIIGGGMPVGAYGGRKEIMEMVAPLGPVYQAGTLSGNPIAMSAGIVTLNKLKNNQVYTHLNKTTEKLADGIRNLAEKAGQEVQVSVYGSMITPFFNNIPVTDYASAMNCQTEKFSRFFWLLIENGIFPPPSQFEAWFVSAAHTDEDINRTLEVFEKAFGKL